MTESLQDSQAMRQGASAQTVLGAEAGVSVGTVVRTVLLVLAVANQLLTASGHAVLALDDATVTQLVSAAFTTAAALAAWWKNNSFTRAARVGDAALRQARTALRQSPARR